MVSNHNAAINTTYIEWTRLLSFLDISNQSVPEAVHWAKLYSRIDIDGPSASLQQSLDNLTNWSIDWQLSIIVQKCCVLSLNNNKLVCQNNNSSYYLNGVLLTSSEQVLDLGITISFDLSFKNHINNIVSKAFQRSSTLFRGFTSRHLHLMRNAFITYIRPLLEYNSIILNPVHVYLIDLLESVQRRFSKRILAISALPYATRLNLLDLQPLELRRLHFDLVNYYKILNGLSPLNPQHYFIVQNSIPSTRSVAPHLLKPLRASNKFCSSFFYRNTEARNFLSSASKSATSVTAFKRALKNIDLSGFLKDTSCRS